jgi:AcrR family transcriptional regulator
MPRQTNAFVRNEPSQIRSRKRRQNILTAATHLLEEIGFEALTTSAIAAKAKIPVSSIYQYFANKEAVVGSILVREMEAVSKAYDDVEETYFRKTDWRTFFDHLFSAVINASTSERVSAELTRATYASPELYKLHDEHRLELAEQLSRFIGGYGSKWSPQRLLKLSLFIYDVYLAINTHAVSQPRRHWSQVERWRRRVMFSLLEEALGERRTGGSR